MRALSLGAGLLVGLLLPLSVSAQEFAGKYDLSGRYSTRRSTASELQVRQVDRGYVVLRKGRFTSNRFRHLPQFTWSSADVQISGRVMQVVYTGEGRSEYESRGLVAGLDPDRASLDDVAAAYAPQRNVFRAVYFLSADGQSLREIVINTTRLGDAGWWRTVSTSGQRQAAPPPPSTLSAAEFRRVSRDAMDEWYSEWIEDYYTDALADATTDAERDELRADRDTDRDLSNNEVMEDEYFEEYVDDRYPGRPYLDEHGQEIPRAAIEVLMLSMAPEFAGIGLSKTFAFDKRTGEIVDEGDLQD
jgi:hypothetical protein